MAKYLKNKLNRLITTWPAGLVKTSSYLEKAGYPSTLIHYYVRSNWLRKLAYGAYSKVGDEPTIYGIVNALTEQLNLPVHLGGLRALDYYGYSHYATLADDASHDIYPSYAGIQKLPNWVQKLPININYVNKILFKDDLALVKESINDLDFVISRPERAILELISLTPDEYSLESVSHVLENLQTLDYKLVQRLLEQCTSIKVKRLFVYLAEEKCLPCFGELNLVTVDFGKGKRKIGEGGHFNNKYGISVPMIDFESGREDV